MNDKDGHTPACPMTFSPVGGGPQRCAWCLGHKGPHSWECDPETTPAVSSMSTIDVSFHLADLLNVDAADISDDDLEHFAVLLESMKIYRERNRRYNGAWQRYGALDSAMHLRSKGLRSFERVLDRVVQEEQGPGLPDFDCDDSIDFVNYAVFLTRNVRAGRWR